MVAAVLDLHIGAGMVAEALDQMARGLAHRHDVVDGDALGSLDAEPGEALGFELLLIADDVIDLVHRGDRASRSALNRVTHEARTDRGDRERDARQQDFHLHAHRRQRK